MKHLSLAADVEFGVEMALGTLCQSRRGDWQFEYQVFEEFMMKTERWVSLALVAALGCWTIAGFNDSASFLVSRTLDGAGLSGGADCGTLGVVSANCPSLPNKTCTTPILRCEDAVSGQSRKKDCKRSTTDDCSDTAHNCAAGYSDYTVGGCTEVVVKE